MYTCLNCNHEVHMTKHGRCADCGSQAIAPLEVTFSDGSREPKRGEYLLREKSQSIDIIHQINEFRRLMSEPCTYKL